MTLRSAAVYGSCGAVLIACLAAANMPSQSPDPDPARPARLHAGPDALAAEIQSQALRLHARMADAPVPGRAFRNPFAFAEAARMSRAQTAPATVQAAVPADANAAAPSAPSLLLMGIAEETSPTGPRRTAIIGGDGDALYMVVEGDSVADRYRVTRIGADAVELEDQTTKGYRRIAMR